MSLYELGKLWALRATYELSRGDLYSPDLALQRATAFDGQWIDHKSYLNLLSTRVRVKYRLGQYAAVLDIYNKLVEETGEDSPYALDLKPAVGEIVDIIESGVVLEMDAEIRERGKCVGCEDSYRFTPIRRKFELAEVNGILTSIDMRCDHRRFESDISELVQWNIPESWGVCQVEIFGQPGTTFTIITLPDA